MCNVCDHGGEYGENVFIKALAAGIGSIVLFAFLMTGSRGGYIVGVVFILLLLVIQPPGRKLTGLLFSHACLCRFLSR